jgi:hypothetical protein
LRNVPGSDYSTRNPPGSAIAALVIDVALLAAVVYAGRVVAFAIALCVDDSFRHLILGSAWPAGIEELRRQVSGHPLLLGRPALLDLVCSDFGPAALILLCLTFLGEALDGAMPGKILVAGLTAKGSLKRAASGLPRELIDRLWLVVAPIHAAHSGPAFGKGFALLQGIEKRFGGEKKFAAIGLLTFGLLCEVFAGRRKLTGDDPWSEAPGALLLYIGTLGLLAALTHFALVSATISPLAADAFMYAGMEALWLPMAGYAALQGQQRVTAPPREVLLGAFFTGAIAASAVCFQRVLLGDPGRLGLWPNLSVVAAGEAIILLCLLFALRSVRITRPIDAAAAGAACALGFAVAFTQGLIAPLLSQLIGVLSALTGFTAGAEFCPLVARTHPMGRFHKAICWSSILRFRHRPRPMPAALWRGRQRNRM